MKCPYEKITEQRDGCPGCVMGGKNVMFRCIFRDERGECENEEGFDTGPAEMLRH